VRSACASRTPRSGRDATSEATRCRVAVGVAALALVADIAIVVLDSTNAI
jgi:hypothetical protein